MLVTGDSGDGHLPNMKFAVAEFHRRDANSARGGAAA